MPSPAHDSDLIIREAGRSLADQRAGGRRKSIGLASAKMKAQHTGRKIANIIMAMAAIFVGLTVAGIVLNGIGFTGLVVGAVLAAAAVYVFGRYPKLKIPERADLMTDDVRRLVGKTELWLEAQRPALPPPAAKLVSTIGVQLDGLQLQLQEVDQAHPTAGQIRKLVGEDLPEMIEGYRRIPDHLRYEERAGSTPNKQLMEGLELISSEIDSVTRQLASGALDDLAIKTRYLDYKYGDADAATVDGN